MSPEPISLRAVLTAPRCVCGLDLHLSQSDGFQRCQGCELHRMRFSRTDEVISKHLAKKMH